MESKRVFTAQFERDLEFLRKCIVRYQETGVPANLAPALFRVYSHAWTLNKCFKKEFVRIYGKD